MDRVYVDRHETIDGLCYRILSAGGEPVLVLERAAAVALRTQLDRLLVLYADEDITAEIRKEVRGG